MKKNICGWPSCFLCKSYFCCSFRTAVPILLKFGTPIHYEMTNQKKIWWPFCFLCKFYFCCRFRTALLILLKFGTWNHYKKTKLFFYNFVSILWSSKRLYYLDFSSQKYIKLIKKEYYTIVVMHGMFMKSITYNLCYLALTLVGPIGLYLGVTSLFDLLVLFGGCNVNWTKACRLLNKLTRETA